MSYHYRPGNRKEELLRELNEVEVDFNSKNKSLEMLKLQAEFYQDKNRPANQDRMSLADEIMNELISNPNKPIINPKQVQPIQLHYKKPEGYKPTPSAPVQQRQNHFINERQLQKNKLQDQKHEGLFPNSSDHNRIRSFGKQQIAPQNDRNSKKNANYGLNNSPQPNPILKKNNSPQPQNIYNPMFNPFVRDEEQIKQRKQQSNRQYLRELEKQRIEQQRKKDQLLKQQKQYKGQLYHNFQPGNQKDIQKPLIMKKADPNSKPPRVELIMGNYSQFDSNLIKSKAIQLKSKYKKGKIIYQEYESQLNKLKKQFNGNLEDLLEENNSNNRNERQFAVQQPIQQERQIDSPKKQIKSKSQSQERIQYNNAFPIKNESINYSQFMHSMIPQQLQSNYTPIPQNLMGSYPIPGNTANPHPEYMDFMKKMFEVCMKEVKEAYTQRLVHQDQTYQQTLNKFMQQTHQNITSQHIPPIMTFQQQRQFYSDAKQHREYFEKQSSIKRKHTNIGQSLQNIPFGESDNSQYYDKSLSGIASKIPLYNGKQKARQQSVGLSGLHQFFNKKYKVKKLKKFTVLVDENQEEVQIPSNSTYKRSKNALKELEFIFNEDLAEMRRLQTNKNVKDLSNAMKKNTTYTTQRRILKQPVINPVKSSASKSPIKDNKRKQINQEKPFLKKYISNDDNIMTFNYNQVINSPINNYSPKSKKEIFEQDQYQTEPRIRQDPQKMPNYIQQYEQRLNIPNKALNFIKMNDEILKKYVKSQQSKDYITIKDSQVKQSNSKDYFSNNEISPVKKNQNQYQESLETIKSGFQSGKYSNKIIKALDSKPQLKNSNSNKNLQKGSNEQRERLQQEIIGSQTVESIQESSGHNSRPPKANRRRPISKKKQSSIQRSKINPAESSLYKDQNNEVSISKIAVPKFDSNVYESEYEESINQKIDPQLIKNSKINQKYKSSITQIAPPTIITPKSAFQLMEKNSNEQQKSNSSKLIQPQSKWVSLEQARKLAKVCRVKEDSKDYRSVQERFSELESFMTKKGDESLSIVKKQTQSGRPVHKSKEKQQKKNKKNIIKLLQDLEGSQEQNYQQQFESYRQQSEQYQ